MLLSNAKAISNRLDTKFNWFIPIDGDGEHIGTVSAERPPTFDYLKDIALTAEKEGFNSLLIPVDIENDSMVININPNYTNINGNTSTFEKRFD